MGLDLGPRKSDHGNANVTSLPIVPYIVHHTYGIPPRANRPELPMPISQERLMSIINAAQDALSKLIELRQFAMERRNAQDADFALQQIWEQCALCTPTAENIGILAAEISHFKKNEHRNRKAAARLRTARGRASPDDVAFAAAIKRREVPLVKEGEFIINPTLHTVHEKTAKSRIENDHLEIIDPARERREAAEIMKGFKPGMSYADMAKMTEEEIGGEPFDPPGSLFSEPGKGH